MSSEEDKMVRVPKEMYESISEIIKKYPQYGWKGPSEFVRDAIRRYIKEIQDREIVYRHAVEGMPDRISEILMDFFGEEEAREVYREINRIEESEPERYIQRVVGVLEGRVGRNLAELLARRLVEVEIDED